MIKKERHWLKQWNPEVAMVTFVGVLVIVGSSVISGVAINDLRNSLNDANAKLLAGDYTPLSVKTNASEINSKLSLEIKLGAICPVSSCKVAGKLKLLVFHSPTCSYCEEQTPILNDLKNKYGDKLDLEYVCTPIHTQDPQLCQENKDGKYLSYAESMALINTFEGVIGGTPTLIFDCQYSRVGSMAIMNETKERNELDKLISTLLSP